MSRLTRFLLHGGALTLAVLVIYLALAPSHIVDGDNAEFAAVGAIGGRPHPSGYPAYVLYLRLMSWLPGASPAHTAAIATVLLSAALVFVLHAACRAWGARPVAATLAVALYAASPVVLRMHTEAEVFGPNALVVATVLWLAAVRGPLRGIWRVAVLALVAGLGLGNHLTCVMVAPIGLLGAVRGIRETSTSKVVTALAGIVGLAVGLSTYAYLLVADGPISFGQVDGLGDIYDFFTRADYGGPGAFLPGANPVSPWTSEGALVATLGRAWLWLPGALGLGMLGVGIARPQATGETRWGWALLLVCWLVAGPVLAFRFNIEPTGLGLYVCQRFHLLPLLLLTIPVALAFDQLGERLAPRIRSERLRSAAFGTGLGVIVFLALTATSLPWLRGVHSPAMEMGVRNMLRSMPPDAVIVVNSEDLCFGADYLQHATGERLDVEVACWLVTSRQWYRERLRKRGVPVPGAYSLQLTRAQAEAIFATGRPLFVDRSHMSIITQLPNYPYGTVVRILPRGETPPPLHEVIALNRTLFAAFDLDYPRPGWNDDYAATAHKRYAITWQILTSALEKVGDKEAAAETLELAKQLAPVRE